MNFSDMALELCQENVVLNADRDQLVTSLKLTVRAIDKYIASGTGDILRLTNDVSTYGQYIAKIDNSIARNNKVIAQLTTAAKEA